MELTRSKQIRYLLKFFLKKLQCQRDSEPGLKKKSLRSPLGRKRDVKAHNPQGEPFQIFLWSIMLKEKTLHAERSEGPQKEKQGQNKKLPTSWVVALHTAYPEGFNNLYGPLTAMCILFPFLTESFYCSNTGERTQISRPREGYRICAAQCKMKIWGPLFNKQRKVTTKGMKMS